MITKKNKKILWTIFSFSVLICLVFVGFWFSARANSTKTAQNTPVNQDLKDKNNYVPPVMTFEIPILMYHYIRNAENEDQLGQNLSVSPENFDAQMKWLSENDYATVNLSDLADKDRLSISKVVAKEKRPVVITFDDGYLDAYTDAFPILKKYGFTGTFFIIRNFTDKKPEYLTSAQIAEMDKADMEIGSHTLSHPNLISLETADATKQIVNSKLESLVFCYPAGKYDTEIKDIVKKANYAAAVTTKPGIATQKSDLFALPRVRIENTTLKAFTDKIDAAYN